MITLKFTRTGSALDTSGIPAEWRNRIQQLNALNSDKWLVAIEVAAEDSSYRYRSMMAKPQLVLKFSLPFWVDFPLGTYVEYMAQTYYLNAPENIKKRARTKLSTQ